MTNVAPRFSLIYVEKQKIKKAKFFDDCPICQTMRAAQKQKRELTSEELKKAFKKAKEGGAIVGGEWFKEKAGGYGQPSAF